MPKIVARLTDLKVRKAVKGGLYPDGAGLYLQVRGPNARSWIHRYMLHGKAREMGLGSYPEVSLDEARAAAENCRRLRQAGVDPIEARKAKAAQARFEEAKAVTFSECAAAYIKAHREGWRNQKHIDQWVNTLKTYVEPSLGSLPVQAVDTGLVLEVLEHIWTTKPETASRIRGRIEVILDWAKVRGFRSGDNPARWRGHIDKLLPKRSKVRKVRHHPALHYDDVPAFMRKLRAEIGTAARALEFLILTAARSAEARKAALVEVCEFEKIWIVPEDRMKAGKEHRVPLSGRSLELLHLVGREANVPNLFPGRHREKPVSDTALHKVLERMGYGDITVHGFRSSFSDWAAERTNYPRDVVEMALAHAIENPVEAAYRRGDLFEKRRALMDAWADYCASTPIERGAVVPFKAVS